jgi:hypothetical protein
VPQCAFAFEDEEELLNDIMRVIRPGPLAGLQANDTVTEFLGTNPGRYVGAPGIEIRPFPELDVFQISYIYYWVRHDFFSSLLDLFL